MPDLALISARTPALDSRWTPTSTSLHRAGYGLSVTLRPVFWARGVMESQLQSIDQKVRDRGGTVTEAQET